MRDPYLYLDREVLRNLLGIMDSKRLQEAESDYVTLRLSEIAEDGRMTGVFDFPALCRMHYRIFQDIYEWAGKPRIVNIEKVEDVLNGISVEYSDVFDIGRDAGAALKKMDSFGWEEASLEDVARKFSDHMAELWKAHPFREGNTRTIVTFCAMFIEERGIYIDSGLFKDNAEYNYEEAKAAFASLEAVLQKGFGELGSSLTTLNGVERLRILHDFYRMGEEEYFSFDFEEAVRVSRDYKDDICNSMLKFYLTYMQDEKRYAKALFIKKYPSSLSDRFLTELATVPAHTIISIDVAPIPKDVTTSTLQKKYMGIESDIIR